MVIGIDLTWLEVLNNSGGAFHYAVRLTFALVKHTDETVIAIVNPQAVDVFQDLQEKSNFKLVPCDSPLHFNAIIAEEHVDIVHSPLQDYRNVTLSVPMVNSLHDLQQFHYPEFFDADTLVYRDKYYRGSAEFSERVIVTYQHVKDDIVKYYGIAPEKIDVCPVGMVEAQPFDKAGFEVVKRKYSLPSRYLFYSAASWPHKNHIRLIQALKIVRERFKINISLICTGYLYPDSYPSIEQAVQKLKMEDAVRFLGYVPEAEMPLLLTNAELVVIPTLYEAGSYPLLEAMAYGVPVICSNVTSLPDSIVDQRFVFNPKNVEEMATLIMSMLQSPKLMEDNRLNSLKITRDGHWNSAVQAFVATYKEAIASFMLNRRNYYVKKCVNYYEREISEIKQNLVNIKKQNDELNSQLLSINKSTTRRFLQWLRGLGRAHY